MAQLGSGALLGMLELRGVYRVVSVHLDDEPAFGMPWGGSLFLDADLPFGLRSAPNIFGCC